MQLTEFEIEQAAARLCEGCTGAKWDVVTDPMRERYRKVVKDLASLWTAERSDQSIKDFMGWVGIRLPSDPPKRKLTRTRQAYEAAKKAG